jgi:hypothetical protein
MWKHHRSMQEDAHQSFSVACSFHFFKDLDHFLSRIQRVDGCKGISKKPKRTSSSFPGAQLMTKYDFVACLKYIKYTAFQALAFF